MLTNTACASADADRESSDSPVSVAPPPRAPIWREPPREVENPDPPRVAQSLHRFSRSALFGDRPPAPPSPPPAPARSLIESLSPAETAKLQKLARGRDITIEQCAVALLKFSLCGAENTARPIVAPWLEALRLWLISHVEIAEGGELTSDELSAACNAHLRQAGHASVSSLRVKEATSAWFLGVLGKHRANIKHGSGCRRGWRGVRLNPPLPPCDTAAQFSKGGASEGTGYRATRQTRHRQTSRTDIPKPLEGYARAQARTHDSFPDADFDPSAPSARDGFDGFGCATRELSEAGAR